MPIDALSILCAQLTHDLLAIAKFLLSLEYIFLYTFLYTLNKIYRQTFKVYAQYLMK